MMRREDRPDVRTPRFFDEQAVARLASAFLEPARVGIELRTAQAEWHADVAAQVGAEASVGLGLRSAQAMIDVDREQRRAGLARGEPVQQEQQ